jgi:serine/threonine-protein kinase RsbW
VAPDDAIDATVTSHGNGRVSGAEPDVELVLPAEAESVALARQMVRGVVDALGWSEESRMDISIAVTEACTNVVMHAYPVGGGEYQVLAWAEPERLRVTVRDHGQGISPRVSSSAAGLGLGMPLMLAIGDEVAFASGGPDGATEVRFTFTPSSRRAE